MLGRSLFDDNQDDQDEFSPASEDSAFIDFFLFSFIRFVVHVVVAINKALEMTRHLPQLQLLLLLLAVENQKINKRQSWPIIKSKY